MALAEILRGETLKTPKARPPGRRPGSSARRNVLSLSLSLSISLKVEVPEGAHSM